MTEAEWLAATDPQAMLGGLEGLVSERKLRLFACGYCRAVWKYITDRHTKGLIRLTEGKADTTESEAELRAIWHTHFARTYVCGGRRLATTTMYSIICDEVDEAADRANPPRSERAIRLMRCVFGNPFRPVAADPSWRTSTVVALARQMYESRDFSPMPVLADALQDAGCDNEDVLDHCRGPGPHVRGCWVVDLILGKQ